MHECARCGGLPAGHASGAMDICICEIGSDVREGKMRTALEHAVDWLREALDALEKSDGQVDRKLMKGIK
jgi:hypothetical protein